MGRHVAAVYCAWTAFLKFAAIWSGVGLAGGFGDAITVEAVSEATGIPTICTNCRASQMRRMPMLLVKCGIGAECRRDVVDDLRIAAREIREDRPRSVRFLRRALLPPLERHRSGRPYRRPGLYAGRHNRPGSGTERRARRHSRGNRRTAASAERSD